MSRPLLLDLFCGAGGAAKGYYDAGFDIVGVDIERQPRYPFTFVRQDAFDFLRNFDLDRFSALHASPPCQRYSKATNGAKTKHTHPDYIPLIRCEFVRLGKPWVIENVPYSPLINPIVLCGTMFGLETYRHRLFEASFDIDQPNHPPHINPQNKMGRVPKPGEFMQIVGHFIGLEKAKEIMKIDWMTRNELAQAIPPVYTEYIGRHLIKHIKE